ncbi:hypothetical protein Tcan_01408, partial [Toxocara canis]
MKTRKHIQQKKPHNNSPLYRPPVSYAGSVPLARIINHHCKKLTFSAALFVKNSISTITTSNRILWPNLVLAMTFCKHNITLLPYPFFPQRHTATNVDHAVALRSCSSSQRGCASLHSRSNDNSSTLS